MSVSASLLQSSGLMFLARMFNRGMGLISTFILARVLTPDDFGIVAIVTIAVCFFDAISDAGIKEYVVQKTDLDISDLNTAWTLNIIVKLAIWFLFICLAPLIADFYGSADLTLVLWCVSLILFFRAFENVGYYLYQRELNYKPMFKLELTQRLLSFGLLLIMLFLSDSYWVMVVTMVFTIFINVLGTYWLHSFRPKFEWSNMKSQWDFSKWLLPKGMIGFLKSEFDALIVSKFFSFGMLGGFNLMKSLTAMVGRDVIQPATEPLVAAFAKSKTEMEKLGNQLVLSVWILTLLIVPVVVYMYVYSELIIHVLYGEQWLEYAPVLSLLSIFILVFVLTGVLTSLLTALANVRALFWFEFVSLFIVSSVLLSMSLESIELFVLVRVGLAVGLILLLLLYVQWRTSAPLLRLCGLILPIVVAAIIGECLTHWVMGMFAAHYFIEFLVSGSVFVISYLLAIVLLLAPANSVSEVAYLSWLVRQHVFSKFRPAE